MNNAIIKAAGFYVPQRVLDNKYFDEMLDQNVSEWLENKASIFKRRWMADGENTSDLAYEAALNCLNKTDIRSSDLDLIIVATDTPDYISPSTASIVQEKLGAKNAGTFDINTACAGFVTALDTGAKYIKADEQYQNILIIGAYGMSRHLDLTDKKTVTLFADGAGAVLLTAVSETKKGYMASTLLTMGQYNSWMGIYGGGTAQPVTEDNIADKIHKLRFVKRFPDELNPQTWSELARGLGKKMGISLDDVDKFFITQININTIRETMKLLGVPEEKAHTIMQDYGYTGSACIPMAFADAWEKELISEGDTVFFIGSGGGLAFAAAAFRL